MVLASCPHYYKVEKAPNALQRPDSTLSANPHRYFILRSGFNAYHMEDMLLRDKGRTTMSYVLGGLGITAGVFAIAVVIVAATKSSCPFVSAYDGKDVSLAGGKPAKVDLSGRYA